MKLVLLASLIIFSCRGGNIDSGQLKEAIDSKENIIFSGSRQWQESKFDEMPSSAKLPSHGWSSHYWPNFHGGLNAKFFGQSRSPLEKFEQAFAKQLREANASYKIGDLSTLERKRIAGITLPWSGICDGSSEASLNFPEPLQAKVINGIIFYPFEIKGLLSYFTAMSSNQRKLLFAGIRVSFEDPNFDRLGRGIDFRYRDVNPGLMHLALVNYMAKQKRGMIADIIAGDVVLNFPIRAFQVISSREENDPEKIKFYRKYNPAAHSFIHTSVELEFGDSHRVLQPLPNNLKTSFQKRYRYVLELDSNREIIGGEWEGESKSDHPDFLWLASENNLQYQDFVTGRLASPLSVGSALTALMTSPDSPRSAELLKPLHGNPDNFYGYVLFKDDPTLPTNSDIRSELGL